MTRDIPTRLLDVLDACYAIQEFTKGYDFKSYDNTRMVRSAVERQISIIGEAMTHVRQADPSMEHGLPEVAQMIGIRNRIIHGYAYVDNEIVWDVVCSKIPDLVTRIHLLLGIEP